MTTHTTVTTTPAATAGALGTRRGRLLLAVLCAVAFLDFVDATIVNVALPAIRDDLGFSLGQLQWVPSGYLLTYGGLMLLGGRLADVLGRRRVLLTGLMVFGLASLTGGLAQGPELLVVARMAQGAGAALSLPAALSILTTSFAAPSDRHVALGVWGAVAGVASAAGVLAGGLLAELAGWQWVLLVNPILCALLVVPVLRLVAPDRPPSTTRRFDVAGAALSTAAMLLLVHTLVEAPEQGWADVRTVLGLAGSGLLAVAFLVVESRTAEPLLPLSVLELPGLGVANLVQLASFAGFIPVFFFVTVYVQDVLGFGVLRTGLAYVPSCLLAAATSGLCAQLISKVGSRPLVVGGALVSSAGAFVLSRTPEDGSYLTDVLPGLLLLTGGIGFVFVTVVAAANAGVGAERAGIAAALLNTAQQVGAALGLAVLVAVSASASEFVDGIGRALAVAGAFLLAAAVLGLRTVNTHEMEPSA